jgi:hypothetical protein
MAHPTSSAVAAVVEGVVDLERPEQPLEAQPQGLDWVHLQVEAQERRPSGSPANIKFLGVESIGRLSSQNRQRNSARTVANVFRRID